MMEGISERQAANVREGPAEKGSMASATLDLAILSFISLNNAIGRAGPSVMSNL